MPRKDYELRTRITARDGMSRNVSRMTGRLGRMQRVAKRLARSLVRVGKAALAAGRFVGRIAARGFVVGAAAVTATFLAVQKMAGGMDDLAKKTREINFPIQDFQEWRFVAEQSGVETEKFDKGMATFNKRLGKLKGGFGPLQSALKKTNPQLAEMLKKTTNASEAMDLVNSAIREAPTADMKSMLADAAFGFTKMSLMANNSAESVDALRKQMRENGVVTQEQARRAEEFNDAMNSTKLAIQGTLRDALTPLMPKFRELADRARAWVIANRDLINQKANEYFDKITDAVRDAVGWIRQNNDTISRWWDLLKNVARGLMRVAEFLFENRDMIIKLTVAVAGLKLAFGAIKFVEIAAGVAGVGASASGAVGGISAATGALKAMLGVVGGLIVAYQSLKFASDQWDKAQDARNKLVNAETLGDRKLAKTDLTRVSDNVLKVQMQGLSDRSERLTQEGRGFSGLMRGEQARIEDEAQLDSTVVQMNRIQREMERRERLQSFSSTPGNTTKTERVEVVIHSENGNAEVTKNSGLKNMTLLTTGGVS